MAEHVQVTTATQTREQAIELGRSVVKARLAAGAQVVGPVSAIFWHHGEFGTADEWQLLLKTRADRYPELEAHVLEQHPWQNPEVTATALVAGSSAYLRWVDSTVRASDEN